MAGLAADRGLDADGCGAMRPVGSGDSNVGWDVDALERSAATPAPATREEMHLAQEAVKRVVGEIGNAGLATGRLVMAFRRILDTEEVVENRPSIRRAVPGLASADEQDDHAATAARTVRRLHRERESPAVAQVEAAHRRLQWTCESVGAEMRRARVALELRVDLTVPGALTGELIDERAHGSRDDDFEAGHAPSLRERPDRRCALSPRDRSRHPVQQR